ncbi:membrane protein insertase YidC [Niveibacterium sp. 24ML]|uniref:membrane protein insertase YidC n=1 Tax=Niveibacterium sp. 24ML TaxID=2985512 RepID=UPI0022722035|nr:membrane protein insertase YidC [Niveibacterium sp. 24ML]MCX9155633.1 membrane protein insertase YidC [Niveibacterium sp. 24ML]
MDNRRLILLVIFSMSLVMLWDAWLKHNQPKTPAAVAAAATQGATPVPSAPGVVAAPPVSGTEAVARAERQKAPKLLIETDLIRAEVSALGGDLVRLELLKHGANDDPKKPFVLFEEGGAHTYLAQSGLIGAGLPNHKTVFALPTTGKLVLKDGEQSLVVRLEAPEQNGIKVAKVLTFHRGTYVVDVGYEINNASTGAVTGHAYYQLTRDTKSAETTAGFFGGAQTYTGPAFYTEAEKYKKIDFSSIEKNEAKLPKPAADGWVAMVQHYFVSAYVPAAGQREFYARPLDGGLVSAGVIQPFAALAAGAKATVSVPLYVGPQEQNKLSALAPGLDLVVDYGWLTVIAAPIFWCLAWLHKLVGNWGWAIIALTVLIKLAFFPLSAASYKSMAKMKTIMPRMKRIQEQYKDDRMKMNQEMMELYKKEKVNPMGGCWPILIQMPVFIALYWVLLGAVEMRQAPWLGWITDLSIKDPYFVLPIIMGVTSLIQMKLQPAPADPVQAKVMMFMPVFFTVMMAWFPAGLVLYWVVNNVLSIGQQWYIIRMIEGGGKAANS